jgi:hypothetical protein
VISITLRIYYLNTTYLKYNCNIKISGEKGIGQADIKEKCPVQ